MRNVMRMWRENSNLSLLCLKVMSCNVMLMLCLLIYLNKTQVNLIHMSAVFPVTAVYLILTDVKTFFVLIVKNNQIGICYKILPEKRKCEYE